MPNPTINDVRELAFQKIGSDEEWLDVFEGGTHFGMKISRVFCIHATHPCQRGRHAHRLCQQIIVPLMGQADLVCKDGQGERVFSLNRSSTGILVPAGIWVEVELLCDRNILMVLCDRPYEEHDYLRDWSEFLTYRAESNSPHARSR